MFGTPQSAPIMTPLFKRNTKVNSSLGPHLIAFLAFLKQFYSNYKRTKYYLSDSGSESGSHKGGGPRKTTNSSSGDGKPTRVRTVLNEKQLHTLRTCYAANPRPDALMKEQLVEMTGLSPRVIRVWFQNKRCKDKKKTLLMKQQMQQEKVSWSLCTLIAVTMPNCTL